MLYIFDKDWTIVKPNDGGKFINSIEKQELMNGVLEKCQQLKKDSHKLAIASNQGGVAFGYMDYKKAMEIVDHAARLIEADDYRFCPHHPQGTVVGFNLDCDCRKPKPGMILELAKSLAYSLDDIIFVGDMDSDEETAKVAGVQFIWAKDFFEYEVDNISN